MTLTIRESKPRKCPADAMHLCPLYRRSHEAGKPGGCMWGGDELDPCAVARGKITYYAAMNEAGLSMKGLN